MHFGLHRIKSVFLFSVLEITAKSSKKWFDRFKRKGEQRIIQRKEVGSGKSGANGMDVEEKQTLNMTKGNFVAIYSK